MLLAFVCATASAQVYRRIGPDGQVYFSDRPGPDADQVDVAPAQAIRLPPVPGQTDTAEQQGGEGAEQQNDVITYTEFTIVSPISEEGIRANDGNVTVHLSLRPELMPGHTIVLRIDGEDGEKIETGRSMAVELSNLSRGHHTVEATVVDDEGKELIHTGPVGFYVLRVARGGR